MTAKSSQNATSFPSYPSLLRRRPLLPLVPHNTLVSIAPRPLSYFVLIDISAQKAQDEPTTRRAKTGAVKHRGGGLVHGTGRVKPNGKIKRSDSSASSKLQAPATTTPHNPVPIKTRTVIDQGPVPLYCSDECQIRDLNSMYGAFSIDYHPDRDSPPPPPVPHNSYSQREQINGSDSDSSGGTTSSVESCSSSLQFSMPSESASAPQPRSEMSPCLATLYELSKWKQPPPAPILCSDPWDSELSTNFHSGIIMAGRRITTVFGSEPEVKRSTLYGALLPQPRRQRHIPGWTDGSNAWRGEVYGLVAPPADDDASYQRDDRTARAYGSFVASPHRSHGIQSTVGQSKLNSSHFTPASFPATKTQEVISAEELYSKYSQSFSRRSESRASLYPSSSLVAQSYPSTAPRRERFLVHPGAQGKLLVPDVKLKARGNSSTSVSSSDWSSSSPTSEKSHRDESDASEDHLCQTERKDIALSLPLPKRPNFEGESRTLLPRAGLIKPL